MTHALPESHLTAKYSRYYLMAQFIFWGSYFLLNLVFMALWKYNSWFNVLLFTLLSLMLGIMSHLLRLAYKRYTQSWSLLRISVHLLWILPIAAICTQMLLTSTLLILFKLSPSPMSDAQP